MNPDDLTREKIFELAKRDPIVQRAVDLWRRKEVSWEQATYMMILQMSDRHSRLLDEHLKLADSSPPFQMSIGRWADEL